jgi:hypothetical protein
LARRNDVRVHSAVAACRLDAEVLSWDFDCFSKSYDELEVYCALMFHELHLPAAFKVSDAYVC